MIDLGTETITYVLKQSQGDLYVEGCLEAGVAIAAKQYTGTFSLQVAAGWVDEKKKSVVTAVVTDFG
jgi:hypothetical protein